MHHHPEPLNLSLLRTLPSSAALPRYFPAAQKLDLHTKGSIKLRVSKVTGYTDESRAVTYQPISHGNRAVATISPDHIPLKPNPIHVLHGGLLFRTYMRYRHLSPPFSLRSIFPTLTSGASLASSSAQKSIDHPPTPPSTMLMDHGHTLAPRVRKPDVTLRQGVQQLTPPVMHMLLSNVFTHLLFTCFSTMSSYNCLAHADSFWPPPRIPNDRLLSPQKAFITDEPLTRHLSDPFPLK